ncbi:hypothetical protein B484DRAFT_400722 [Ochromonadaceae sp. CCMP2298]|nr:hypothetical protein B484DRAFT_400722 [Ochromonadaceae sp. CCMP2298]|eukprot:CAMPEP_0173243796 /NCGR_PEP_ID=MMETSP1142-20121109/15724_1 /TAXON_ID=483371 /ORGANISM="non described non described, Strain CCMP2298" /LENGTH=146 /DNA_ID=CAMNT_0014175475 /DNA_START=42 /DNA_END=482 /DNA_ORIENTATION=+
MNEGTPASRTGFSSLPLQMMLYFSNHFTPLFFILNILLYTYKATQYFFPGRLLGWELTTVFMFLLIDGTRLILASKGNKTSTIPPLVSSLVLAMPMIVLHAYYISLQTYILRIDIVLNSIALVLLGSETILSVMVFLNIYLASRKY